MDDTNFPLPSSSNVFIQSFSTEKTDSHIHAVLPTVCEEANSVKSKLGVMKEEKNNEESISVPVFVIIKLCFHCHV